MLRQCLNHTCPRKPNGQAYLEFILVLPVMLLLILLVLDFGEYLWGRMVVSTGTFEAARQVANGHSTIQGLKVYKDVVGSGLGSLNGSDTLNGLSLSVQPAQRSVRAQANIPWTWPFGTPVLLGASPQLHLKASAFFRLERLYLGPPGPFE